MVVASNQEPARGVRDQRTIARTVLFGLAAIVLILAVSLLPPLVSGIAIGSILILLVLMAQPMAALYLLAFSVPYESLREVQAGGLNATATEFIAFCGGVTFLLRAAVRRETGARWSWWFWPLMLFIATAAFSVVDATEISLSIKELLKLGEMVLTYLMVLSFVDSRARLNHLLVIIVLAVTSEALLGIFQGVAHFGPASFARGALLRASGTFDQPNPYSFYLNLTLPLLVAGLMFKTRLAGRLTIPAVCLTTLALLLTVSRNGILAFATALVIMIVIAVPRGRPLVSLGAIAGYIGVAGAVFGIVPWAITDKVLQGLGIADIDITHPTPVTWAVAERLAHVVAGIRMFLANPILGVGIGNYAAVYKNYRVINTHLPSNDPAADLWQNPLGHAHNYYVNVAAETGIVGATAFGILLLSGLIILIVLYRRAADPTARALTLGAIGVYVTVIVESFFDDLFVHAMEAQWALVMGIATVACRLSVAQARPERQLDG